MIRSLMLAHHAPKWVIMLVGHMQALENNGPWNTNAYDKAGLLEF